MKWKLAVCCAALSFAGLGSALAAAGPEQACQALSERAQQAVAMKKQGLPVDKAVETQSAQSVPDGVPAGQHGFFKEKLPSAVRFAYMAGMSETGTAQFYLKQCIKGS